jgi:hypothetical protein
VTRPSAERTPPAWCHHRRAAHRHSGRLRPRGQLLAHGDGEVGVALEVQPALVAGEHDEGEHAPADLEGGDVVAERVVLDRSRARLAVIEDLIPGQ